MEEIINSKIFYTDNTPTGISFFELPIEEQRYLFYSNIMNKIFDEVKVNEYYNKICFSKSTKKICFSKKPYIKTTKTTGFTYHKNTGKVVVWFGTNIRNFINEHKKYFIEFLNMYNIDWLDINKPLVSCITKTSLEKILSGKITNPIDFCKHYIKVNLKSNISPKLFYKLLLENKHDISFNNYLSVAKDGDNLIRYLLDGKRNNFLADLVNQCKILDCKINFNWSDKRFFSEHNKLTEKILEYEIKNRTFESNVEYKGYISLPKYWKLIDSEKELFIEGSKRKHCVYSYWDRVKEYRYFVISVNEPDNNCTIGIDYYNGMVTIDQIYGYKNSSVSPEFKNDAILWLKTTEAQNFFYNNCNTTTTILEEEEDDDLILHGDNFWANL